jgi:nitroreductase
MDALTALTTRVSPIKLTEPAPSAEALAAMLAAAGAAPDHGKLRPWRFLKIEGTARARFGEMLARSLLRREPEAPAGKLEAERKNVQRAPLVIVAAAAIADNPKIPDVEQIVAVGAAVQNLLLAAHALGYGGFWRTGAAAYDPLLKQELGLAPGDAIVGFLYLGSVETPGVPRRNDPEAALLPLPG